MDSDPSSDHGAQDTSRLRESVSMALRQLQQPQLARAHSDEIPESDEGESEDNENTNDDDGDEDAGDGDADHSDADHSDGGHSNDRPQEPPRRQHRGSVSSNGSHYNPSATSSEAEASPVPTDHRPSQVETAPADIQPVFAPLRPKPPLPRTSPYSTVPPTPTHHSYWSSPRKRSLSPPPNLAGAAAGAGDLSPRPFKRHRSAPFNHAYLSLLNSDILDAAQRYTPQKQQQHRHAQTTSTAAEEDALALALGPSQLGLTHWSEAEKLLLFEALARLGRDDAAGIAARVRTKGTVEVGAYLDLLGREAATATATAAGLGAGAGAGSNKTEGLSSSVTMADMPAAVELSQACCAALEEAADAVAVRQEGYEDGVERRRWGDGRWLVGKGNWRALEAEPPEGLREGLGLLRVGSWLRLSERVFMNSAVDEYNWARVEAEEPALRATAVEDFYALAVGMTRRLVAATIFVGEARVKARRELYPDARNRVWKQDVEAAALSLGFPTSTRQFWAKCARRLRLDVYEEEEEEGWESAGEREPMSYDEVERALGLEAEVTGGDAAREETESSEEELDQDLTSGAGSDDGSIELGAGTPYASDREEPLPEEDEAEKEAVTRELNEVLVHSALEYPKSGKPRTALRNRIRAERAHEAYADRLDAKASYYEEKRLWGILERQPPTELVKPDVSEEPRKWTKRTAGDLIRGFARTPGDWRSKLDVVPNKWEMDYALEEEGKRDKAKVVAAESGDEI